MPKRAGLALVHFAAAGLAAVLPGCGGGDSLPRQEVSGQVTLDGQPLADGTIQFQPDPAILGPAVPGGATITGGAYRIGRDEGLVPGAYKVMIFSHIAAKDEAASAAPGSQDRPAPELIPPQYNSASKLTAEIVKGKPNVLNFPLKK